MGLKQKNNQHISRTNRINRRHPIRTDIVRNDLHIAEPLARCVQVVRVICQHVRTPRAVLVQLDFVGVRRQYRRVQHVLKVSARISNGVEFQLRFFVLSCVCSAAYPSITSDS